MTRSITCIGVIAVTTSMMLGCATDRSTTAERSERPRVAVEVVAKALPATADQLFQTYHQFPTGLASARGARWTVKEYDHRQEQLMQPQGTRFLELLVHFKSEGKEKQAVRAQDITLMPTKKDKDLPFADVMRPWEVIPYGLFGEWKLLAKRMALESPPTGKVVRLTQRDLKCTLSRGNPETWAIVVFLVPSAISEFDLHCPGGTTLRITN